MKNIPVIILGIVALILAVAFFTSNNPPATDAVVTKPVVSSSRDMTVVVSSRIFTLINGEASVDTVPNSESKETLLVFGNPILGDLDKDGDDDAALLLQYSGGGTGVFYYAVFALNDANVYRATNALLLGDRIAPQSIEIKDGRAVYNFADRAAEDPMSTPASIGRSVWIQYNPETDDISEWVWGIGDNAPVTERYKGQIDRVEVTFEHRAYTEYRLVTNGTVREGELNTERGYGDDSDATVYVLNWRAPVGEQLSYVRFTDEPTKLYLLNSERAVVRSSVLTLE